jgi:hypothetical protein
LKISLSQFPPITSSNTQIDESTAAHRRTSRTLQVTRPSLSQEGADRGVDLQEVLDPAGMAGSGDNDLCLGVGQFVVDQVLA